MFEACCNVLERLLKPVEEENLDLNSTKEKESYNFNSSKNRSNPDAGILFYFNVTLTVILQLSHMTPVP